MDLPAAVLTTARRVPRAVNTTEQANKLIDRELLPEVKLAARWTFAREKQDKTQTTSKKRDHTHAKRQNRQALSNDKMLDEHAPPPKERAS